MNDEDFMKTARELARKDYAKGIRAEEEFDALRDAFMLVVSPDRVGLVESMLKNASNSSGKGYIHPSIFMMIIFHKHFCLLETLSTRTLSCI